MAEIDGTDDADNLIGTPEDDTIRGYAGDDVISGGDGDDRIFTGDGADTVFGGEGDDEINGYLTGPNSWNYSSSVGPLLVYGEGGDDFVSGSSSADFISGGDGDDFLVGNQGDDQIFGNRGNDTLLGREGNDLLEGGEAEDELDGGSGDDTLMGGPGGDILWGGDGNDLLYGGDGDDFIVTGNGSDTVYSGNGNDNINGYLISTTSWTYFESSGSLVLNGEEGDDFIHGSQADDFLNGGAGNDYLIGAEGNDRIEGGSGDDYLDGGSGDDTLNGGLGVDELWGGSGNDVYFIADKSFDIWDADGIDTANVLVNFVKIPSFIEHVNYIDGAVPLPYWIDALLPDRGAIYSTFINESRTLYFGFPDSIPEYDTDLDNAVGYEPFNDAQKSFVRSVLAYIESIIDVRFVETTNFSQPNTIVFANNIQEDSSGYALFPDKEATGSDVFLDVSSDANLRPRDGEYAVLTYIHEIGHALGLKHPFGSADAIGEVSESPYLPIEEDNTSWTVMSYEKYPQDYHAVFKNLDIAALQYLYGPSTTTRDSDNVYVLSEYDTNFIWDGGGTDTVDASQSSTSVTIFLEPGYWGFLGESKAELISAPGQITINFGTKIENLVGSRFNDWLFGNSDKNEIVAGSGNDSVRGNQGDDIINGGDGIDTAVFSEELGNYVISRADNVLTVVGPEVDGTDRLTDVERLSFSDISLAFDLDGSAGDTARLLAVALGKDNWYDRALMGIGIDIFDNSGLTFEEIATLALDILLGTERTNKDVFTFIVNNVVGVTPTQADYDTFLPLLDNGTFTQSSLFVAAAEHPINDANIGLVGLIESGVEFIPV